MKKYNQRPLRHALAVLTAGLVLGGMVAANAQNPTDFPTNVYYMGKNVPAGTLAPYRAGGGVPAGALIATPVVTSTNCTISWYGMRGWSTVQGSTELVNWVNLTNVAAKEYSWSTTVPNTLGAGASFRLSQNNAYVGVSACAGCHADKYNPWSQTTHAGVYNNPEAQADFSLICRTIGYGQGGFIDAASTPHLENVGCENCHGPAGWHKASEKDMITPAVSLDPAICGSCHQGSKHPTYQEYTNVISSSLTNLPMGVIKGGVGHSVGDHTSLGCSTCHAANNRMAMIKEYYDRLAGNPHPVTLFSTVKNVVIAAGTTNNDANVFGAASCATCHDPHTSNYVAQLRYSTYSTNWYCVPTVTDPTPVLTTNSNGSITTNSASVMANNTIFDSFYNPNIQICGQCHAGGRGMRWNGSAYGLITNNVYSTNVTSAGFVPVTTYVTNVQVITNISYGYIWTNGASVGVTNITIMTNNYVFPYGTTNKWVASVTNILTTPTLTVGAYYPLIAYTNGGTVYYSTNSSGESVPHYPVQYNVLIGMADYDYATNAGVANKTHSHTRAPDQCVTCHVPSYSVNAGTNVTGHTFVRDNYGCMSSCHSSYSSAGLDAKVLNLKVATSNSMARVVSLLNQWATNMAPDILRTNYAQLAWEFPSPGAFGTKSTNNGVKYTVGPPSAYKPALGAIPSGTNDNLQLSTVPQDIRIARFSLYVIYEDQSLGVHNPTYVSSLLADAETRVMNQFTSGSYPATFAATTLTGFAPLSVAFTNYGIAGSFSWAFGDGGTTNVANPTYTYNAPGLYSVTCTADGKPLTRSQYIRVLARPVVSFTADNTTVAPGTTVNFTNTSSSANDVYLWRWYPMNNTNSGVRYDTAGGVFSFTYTNAGTYDVRLRASTAGGNVTNSITGYITVH